MEQGREDPARDGSIRIVSRVPLLDVAPGLGAQLCPEELRDARSRCLVSVGLSRGRSSAALVAAADGGFLQPIGRGGSSGESTDRPIAVSRTAGEDRP
jgi:hypothetical protein